MMKNTTVCFSKLILDRWEVKYREAVKWYGSFGNFKTKRFDLLFMDARMPGIDGLKATQFNP